MVSLCSFRAYPGTQSGDQAGLELIEIRLPLLGLKACATNAQPMVALSNKTILIPFPHLCDSTLYPLPLLSLKSLVSH
ncbi:hypothetical protein I79_005369 [Cricetulus griseus]|uniref:Uncharacterized protein n=1 Tax=Cricetulus griseus TaxID=10029 RepID=G3H504_CRIGR|nr:hypothetical protein I79_005369 [Cricetulus griseus]